MKSFDQIREKHLTPAEMKKREEVAKAIKRENPNMPMAKKMAIATATAKKVAESVQDMASMGGRSLARIANTVGHPDIAAAKNELARRRMRNEEVEVEEATLSAKAARAGKDIGKPGKTFDKIAAKAAEKYGSKEAGQRVAGAILKKMRANEEVEVAEERVISGGYRDKDGKYHPPKTASSIVKDRLAKKVAIMQKTATAMRNEDTELDESITRVSDAKLKFHAVNGVPHGSYSKSEISAEHNRRKKTGGAEYAAVKPSMNEAVTEAADMSKLKLLARAGLVDSKDVERLMSAFKVMQAGKPLTQQQKDLVISSYGELASIVTGDSQTFQKAKKAVSEAIGD